jgi:hypothetical protein
MGISVAVTCFRCQACCPCRYRSCFARMRQVTYDSPLELLEDTGQSRRSTRVRTQPDVFLPSYSSGAEELATR